MITIAVDAMGGDTAPKSEVEGAIQAARALGVRVYPGGSRGCDPNRNLAQHERRRDYPSSSVTPVK